MGPAVVVKERPILFSGPMVRAILEGRKTQTRRVVAYKPPPKVISPLLGRDSNPTGEWFFTDPIYERVGHSGHFCPYGVPGDRLWVKETFWACDQPGMGDVPCLVYADEHYGKDYQHEIIRPGLSKFGHIPGIFMPRWASRITLEITDVRVQRVQEISEEDAQGEGAPVSVWALHQDKDALPADGLTYRSSFHDLWDSINAKKHPWSSNPWVWVLSFRRVN